MTAYSALTERVGQGEVHPKGENSMGLGFRKVALTGWVGHFSPPLYKWA